MSANSTKEIQYDCGLRAFLPKYGHFGAKASRNTAKWFRKTARDTVKFPLELAKIARRVGKFELKSLKTQVPELSNSGSRATEAFPRSLPQSPNLGMPSGRPLDKEVHVHT